MWKFYFLLSNIIVVIPLISQWILGNLYVNKKNETKFNIVFIVNVVAQFLLVALSFIIQGYSFALKMKEDNPELEYANIPPPALGVLIGFICGCILMISFYFQSRKIY